MEDLNDSNVLEAGENAAQIVAAKAKSSAQVLEELGPYLTNVNLGKRKIGLAFLSEFLSNLPKDFLNADECSLFSAFYQDRLNDHHSLIPDIIKGAESIFKFDSLSGENLCQLFQAFFMHIHTQSQVVTDRRRIFAILDYLLHSKANVLKTIESEFVLAFIQAVDSEKDPINIKVIFGLWPIILSSFKLEPFEEDTFEAMSCYFPIDFAPHKGSEVTKEELVMGLRNCLAASSLFAPLAMPLFLEKLDSELSGAKIDSNLTLVECLKVYSPTQIQPHLKELWELLKKEILGIKMNINEEVISSCHLVIHNVTLALSKAVQTIDNRQILEDWLNLIWQDVGRHLLDIELKFMSLTIDILTDVISTKMAFPSAFMLEKAMPILLQSCEGSKKAGVLFFMTKLLRDSANSGQSRPAWYDKFLFTCNSALTTSELGKAAAFTLCAGGHFLEAIDAEQIFDSVLLSDHDELIFTCIKQCHGSRPRSDDIEKLFELRKGQTLAVVYRDSSAFQNDLDKVLTTFIHDDFGIDLLLEVLKYHAGNGVSKDIIERILSATLSSKNNKKNELIMAISPKLNEDFSSLVNEASLTMPLDVNKSLIAYASPKLINALESSLLRSIFNNAKEDDLDLAHLKAAIVNKIDNPDSIIEDEDFCPRHVVWITKGLLYRLANYGRTHLWVDKLLECLRQGVEIDFDCLVSNIDSFLECPHVKAGLAKQKLFNLTKVRLISAFKANINPTGHLKALIGQLPHVPKFALTHELAEILPLLLQGLKDPTLVLASLTCLQDLLEHDPESFSQFIPTFLPIWLSMSKDSKTVAVQTRIKALQCIKTCCKIKDVPVRYKKEVLKGLVPALDDHKRLVRQAASSARNQWSIC